MRFSPEEIREIILLARGKEEGLWLYPGGGQGVWNLADYVCISKWTSLRFMRWFNKLKEHLLFCSRSFRPWSLKMNRTFSCSQGVCNLVKYVDAWRDVFSKVLE